MKSNILYCILREKMKCPVCKSHVGETGKQEDSPVLMIKHKITKLSQDRIGIYFNKNIVRSLKLKSGMEIYVGVKDKNHIVIKLE